MREEVVEGYDLVFPVFGGELDKNGLFDAKNIYGTAFYINNNTFITCGHTIRNANQHSITALAFTDQTTSNVLFRRVLDSEIFDQNDSGLIVTDIKRAKPLKLRTQKLEMLHDVFIVGYPYGFDVKNGILMIRSFKGHIIRPGAYMTFNSKPPYYELSFMCPRGLSGAPLLFRYNDNNVIVGMAIGNEMTDMIVSSFKETTNEGSMVTTYEKTETLHLGVAVQTESFLNIKSRILNGNIGDYLSKEKLLI